MLHGWEFGPRFDPERFWPDNISPVIAKAGAQRPGTHPALPPPPPAAPTREPTHPPACPQPARSPAPRPEEPLRSEGAASSLLPPGPDTDRAAAPPAAPGMRPPKLRGDAGEGEGAGQARRRWQGLPSPPRRGWCSAPAPGWQARSRGGGSAAASGRCRARGRRSPARPGGRGPGRSGSRAPAAPPWPPDPAAGGAAHARQPPRPPAAALSRRRGGRRRGDAPCRTQAMWSSSVERGEFSRPEREVPQAKLRRVEGGGGRGESREPPAWKMRWGRDLSALQAPHRCSYWGVLKPPLLLAWGVFVCWV